VRPGGAGERVPRRNQSRLLASSDPGGCGVIPGRDQHNATSTLVLNGLFPNATNPHDGSKDFAGGDLFGTANLTLEVR
jgi:hypothetical protein